MPSGPRCLICLAVILSVIFAQSADAKGKRIRKGGPPPFEYFRIMGDAVPDWDPAMIRPRGAPAPKLDWVFLGARPIANEVWSGSDDASGRISALATHPTDPLVAYAAGASGGLWKTTDGGANWVPLTDYLPNLNSGAVALHPNNPDTVYYGTGEYPTGASGDGLFRSLDGGASWVRIATTAQVGTTISRIAVDPDDPLKIHVAGNSGYVRTTNGGVTWSSAQLPNCSDLLIDPSNPSVLYAGRHSVGIFKSTDGGQTWSQLTNGLPSSNVRRINIAIAASNPQVLYAGILNSSSGLRGFYKTTNGGNSWTQMTNTPDYPYPQGWYDHFVGCDPTNANIVYAGGVFPTYAIAGVVKSTNGGNSWTDITVPPGGGQLHPDMHCIAFGPDGTVWIGNDGGVWNSTNGGFSWNNCNATLAVTQNYQIALHPTDPNSMMTGTQDNGTLQRTADVLTWPQLSGGDGGFLVYDFEQPMWRYITYIYLITSRYLGSSYNANITGPWSGDNIGFIAPLIMDPNDPQTLLGGTNRVWRTQNARASSVSWTAISTTAVSGLGGLLTALAVAHGDSNFIYTGSSLGRVYVTTDASTWNNRSPAGSNSAITDIMLDPLDGNHAFVSSNASNGARVYETTDAGLTWTSATGDLPAGLSGRALAVDWRTSPPRLFLGTGVGVYASYDGGATWIKEFVNLPNVNIGDLVIDEVRKTLVAGTYGRGAWRTPLPCLPGDMDGDDIVDADDVPLFVAALLDDNPDPDSFCAADLNDDGLLNGDDIAPFVQILLGN